MNARTRSKAALAATLLCVSILLPGCAALSSGSAAPTSSVSAGVPAGPVHADGAPATGGKGAATAYSVNTPGASRSPLANRMVIRTGNVRLQVPKTLDAVSALRALSARYGGVVAALQISSDTGGDTQPAAQPAEQTGALKGVPSGLPFSGSVTVLVPVARFDAFRSAAEKIGRVLSESSGDEDVTQQHADLAARLDNARAEEARLRGFFSSARNVSEMLAVERELTRVRGDIESMTAQLATLESQAAMGTLTVELVQPLPVVRPAGVDWGFSGAVTTGFRWLARIVKAAIILGITLLPPVTLGFAVVIGVQALARRRRSRKPVPSET